MIVSYDPQAGATYVELNDSPVTATQSLGDLVMIDLDADNEVVGVEFVVAPRDITQDMVEELMNWRPATFKPVFEDREWLLTTSS